MLLAVRSMELDFIRCSTDAWPGPRRHGAEMLFNLLRKTTNVLELDLAFVPFSSFPSASSITMRTSSLLPALSNLTLATDELSHSILLDLLATSNQQIKSLNCMDMAIGLSLSRVVQPLDFGRNLRHLSTNCSLSRWIRSSSHVVSESLAGLESLTLQEEGFDVPCGRMEELFRIVGPTLRKFRIDGRVDNIAQDLPLLTHLDLLSLTFVKESSAAVFRHFPLSISTLLLDSDFDFAPTLMLWRGHPTTAPQKLKHLSIMHFSDLDNFGRLPSLNKLSTYFFAGLGAVLGDYSMTSVPFRILELSFDVVPVPADLDRIKLECERLSVHLSMTKADF